MSVRGETYARDVDAVFADIGATMDRIGDDQWQTVAPEDGRQINVLLDHIINTELFLTQVLERYAAGESLPPITGDDVENGNQQHIRDASGVSRSEVGAKFDQAQAKCRAVLPTLTDEVLDRTEFFGPFGGEVTPSVIIEAILIGHAREHLESIQAALAG